MRQLELRVRSWGGRRDGAGRKPAPGRRPVAHRRRVSHDRNCPAHVTLRASTAVPSLRHESLFIVTRNALASASTERFRVLHFSVQADHLHLVVEANGPTDFEHGVRGLAIRVAKAVNRALGRHGRVWGDRIPRASLADAAGSAERARLRAEQLPQAHPRRAWPRPTIVRVLVRRLADPARADPRSVTRGRSPDMARAHRLATTRTDRRRGTSSVGSVTMWIAEKSFDCVAPERKPGTDAPIQLDDPSFLPYAELQRPKRRASRR